MEPDHAAARAFARRVARVGKNPEAVHLARAYLSLHATIDHIGEFARSEAMAETKFRQHSIGLRLRKILGQVDALLTGGTPVGFDAAELAAREREAAK